MPFIFNTIYEKNINILRPFHSKMIMFQMHKCYGRIILFYLLSDYIKFHSISDYKNRTQYILMDEETRITLVARVNIFLKLGELTVLTRLVYPQP